MVFFEWKEEYEVGLPQIDLQHTMIVNMINELYTSLESEAEEDVTAKILAKLLGYVKDHFAAEEKAMRENDYPFQESHFAEHDAFREKVSRLHGRHQTGEKIAAYELAECLKEWLLDHIAGVDRVFGAYVFQLSEDAREAFCRQNPTHPLAK